MSRVWEIQRDRGTTGYIHTVRWETGLLTVLLPGKQGWKCPVALLATCCGSKSLKVILIDSHFGGCPESPCHSVIDPIFQKFYGKI